MQPLEDRTRTTVRATPVSSEFTANERPQLRLGLIAALASWLAIFLAIVLLFT